MKKLVSISLILLLSIVSGLVTTSAMDVNLLIGSFDVAPFIAGSVFAAGSFIFIPSPGMLLTSYSFVSVEKPANGGLAKPMNDKLLIFRMDDVLTFPSRDDKGILISDDLVLNDGATAIEIEVTPDTLELIQTTEGDMDCKGTAPELKATRPGTVDHDFEEFIENNKNENLGVIIRYCESGLNPKLVGTPCNPLQMSVTSTSNKEKDGHELTFTSYIKGRRSAIYTGTIPDLDTDSGSGSGA